VAFDEPGYSGDAENGSSAQEQQPALYGGAELVLATRRAPTVVLGEDPLAEADRGGGDLHQLIGRDELDR
jgi:hypothetical protein